MADSKLRVQLIGDASRLTGTLNKASARLKSFGKNVSSIGASMQRFALPLALAGGAAIKMGADFDKSLTKIKSLVGIAGDEVDKMGKKARQMAIETGASSTDAADALFFITSAGLEGSDAMDVLNASLKASAVGLGDVTQVADAATSAMNAYGSDTLSASDATDVLVAAVREGKLSSEELSGSIGSVIPIASNMGVTFNEVGATMAAMSRTGTNAATASMQLKNILMSINKPSSEAAKELTKLGLSSASLKEQIKQEGLLSVLETLKSKFEKNADAQSKVFGNSRALMGVMDLLGKGIDSTREIFGELNNVQGATQKAFNETSKSASFKLTKALNTAKESFAEMGSVLLTTLLPLIQDITGFITRLFQAFNKLDPGMQKFIAASGVLAVALPTIIGLFGTLLTAIGALLSPIGIVVLAIAGIGTAIYKNWETVGPVLVKLYNRFVDLYNSSLQLRLGIHGLGAVFKSVFIGAKTLVLEFSNIFVTMWELIKEFSEKGMDGDFLLVLAKGFNKGEQIAKDGADEISGAFTDAFVNGVTSKLEHKTFEGVTNALKNVATKAKGMVTGILSGNNFGGAAGGGGGDDKKESKGLQSAGIVSVGKDPITLLTEGMKENKPAFDTALNGIGASLTANLLIQQEKMQKFKEIGLQMGESIKGTFSQMGSSIAQSLGAGESALGTFAGVLIETAMTALGASLATTMGFGAESAGATAKSMGPLAAFVLPALLAGAAVAVKGAFSKVDKPKKFAAGGIVSTPTMGLMGEYPGARSNPEVIAPLDKLKGMIGDRNNQKVQVGGSFTLKGQDLVVALQRANKQRNRVI
jgi:TP901 family phage tail tape measure protein